MRGRLSGGGPCPSFPPLTARWRVNGTLDGQNLCGCQHYPKPECSALTRTELTRMLTLGAVRALLLADGFETPPAAMGLGI
jgi:hypothetical protein